MKASLLYKWSIAGLIYVVIFTTIFFLFGSFYLLDIGLLILAIAALLIGACTLIKKGWVFFSVSAVIIASVFFYPKLSQWFYWHKFEQIKAYVAQVEPGLDQYHRAHFVYPEKLDDLNLAKPPSSHLQYNSTGPDFEFIYYDPQYFIDYRKYQSSTKTWTVDN